MAENELSEDHKALLALLERMKAEEEKSKKKKKLPSIRQEKRLQYYSGWSPRV